MKGLGAESVCHTARVTSARFAAAQAAQKEEAAGGAKKARRADSWFLLRRRIRASIGVVYRFNLNYHNKEIMLSTGC